MLRGAKWRPSATPAVLRIFVRDVSVNPGAAACRPNRDIYRLPMAAISAKMICSENGYKMKIANTYIFC